MLDPIDPLAFVRHLVADTLLLPPGQTLVCWVVGLLVLWRVRSARWRWLAGALLVVQTVLLAVLATPIASAGWVRWVESLAPPALPVAYLQGPVRTTAEPWDAVVVLTGGLRLQAPEYGGEPQPNEASWERLRYGERLAHAQGLPLLIAGGGPFVGRGGVAEATVLARQVQRVPPDHVWAEGVSVNTEAAPVHIQHLYPQVRRVVLVSDATHLVRAVPAFERAGFVVLGAPTRHANIDANTPLAWLPNAATLADSRRALHTLWGWLALHL